MVARLAACLAGVMALGCVAAPAQPSPHPALAAASAPLPPTKQPLAAAREQHTPAKILFGDVKLPSRGRPAAIGYYPRGCLAGGVALPANGPNWQIMRLSRNRNWGHPELVNFLKRFAPLAAKATGWPGILIGDMAQPRGGPTVADHMSHQTGLDVDIWFRPMPDRRLSAEERETLVATSVVAADKLTVDPETWTSAHAAFIRAAAEQPEVERVLVNAAIKKELCRLEAGRHRAWMSKVRPWYGHADHMHVLLKCPADSPQCRPQPPVPAGDGCSDKELSYWFSEKVLHPVIKPPAKPPKPIMLADLPRACKAVLEAPPKADGAIAKTR